MREGVALILGSDKEIPSRIEENGFGLWWAFLFLWSSLAEGLALPGINR